MKTCINDSIAWIYVKLNWENYDVNIKCEYTGQTTTIKESELKQLIKHDIKYNTYSEQRILIKNRIYKKLFTK